jgi:DUF438 domain-containing protein
MSEYINNTQKRKELIKEILKELNRGRSIEEVRTKFSALLDDVDAPTITEVEQMLITEGTPVDEIQRLCDIHMAFFRDSLAKVETPESLPGHPVYTVRAENQAATVVLDELKKRLDAFLANQNPATQKTVLEQLRRLQEYDRHFIRKENLLFPVLEKVGFFGPSQVMWGIHNDIRAGWNSLTDLLKVDLGHGGVSDVEEVKAVHQSLDTALREMFFKEDKILIPAALEKLKDSDWKEIRRQEAEIGYAYVQPGSEWGGTLTHAHLPESGLERVEKRPDGDLIPLQTGSLSAGQIDLFMRTLPVDVTYVDEHDEVRYYSQTKERIFPRSPAIIGRKVQNCHPPQSVSKVQQIIDDFRAGKRDMAEFWIQMADKFVVIQYFALRDEQGTYKGALEVSQDAAHLRSLKGEKRLLDDRPA